MLVVGAPRGGRTVNGTRETVLMKMRDADRSALLGDNLCFPSIIFEVSAADKFDRYPMMYEYIHPRAKAPGVTLYRLLAPSNIRV